jgi:hypothetical protein
MPALRTPLVTAKTPSMVPIFTGPVAGTLGGIDSYILDDRETKVHKNLNPTASSYFRVK